MTEQRAQQKGTIQEVAKSLNIGRRTIYRWIDKGLLSKVKEGNKTYVLINEVEALCAKGAAQGSTKFESSHNQDTNNVTIERTHYEGLLIRLGQLENEKRYLLEYKTGLEEKDKELERLKEKVENIKSRSLWQRIFNKF